MLEPARIAAFVADDIRDVMLKACRVYINCVPRCVLFMSGKHPKLDRCHIKFIHGMVCGSVLPVSSVLCIKLRPHMFVVDAVPQLTDYPYMFLLLCSRFVRAYEGHTHLIEGRFGLGMEHPYGSSGLWSMHPTYMWGTIVNRNKHC